MNGHVEKIANNSLLVAAGRVFAVVTPMLFTPFLLWLFSTVNDTQLRVAELSERIVTTDTRVANVDHRVDELTQTLKDFTKSIDEAKIRRQQDWDDIRERMTRQETQTSAILKHLDDIQDLLKEILRPGQRPSQR